MEQKKKIILVDDHVIVRTALKGLVERLGPYMIVHEFDDAESLLKAVPFDPPADLLILDLSLPGKQGDEVVELLNKAGEQLPVLILTLNRDEPTIIKLFRNGVRGYLEKNTDADEMKSALYEIFRCGYYHNEFLTMSLKQSADNSKKSVQENILAQLTGREKEFLRLVCHEKEYTYDQIGFEMGIQHRTVDGYRESIFEKFGIRSKTGLVLFVLKHKLFEHLQAAD